MFSKNFRKTLSCLAAAACLAVTAIVFVCPMRAGAMPSGEAAMAAESHCAGHETAAVGGCLDARGADLVGAVGEEFSVFVAAVVLGAVFAAIGVLSARVEAAASFSRYRQRLRDYFARVRTSRDFAHLSYLNFVKGDLVACA